MLVLRDLFGTFGFRLVLVFLVLVPNTYVAVFSYIFPPVLLSMCHVFFWLNGFVVPVTCDSSALLETVVYFEFCTSVPMSMLCLYPFIH